MIPGLGGNTVGEKVGRREHTLVGVVGQHADSLLVIQLVNTGTISLD